jgi:hypothetical protein
MREKLLYLVLQLVKTFSMLDGVQDEAVRECFDETFELWMSIFISALQGSITLNLGIKKYILKVSLAPRRHWSSFSETCSATSPTGSTTSPPTSSSFGSSATKYCLSISGRTPGSSLPAISPCSQKPLLPPRPSPTSTMTQTRSARRWNRWPWQFWSFYQC